MKQTSRILSTYSADAFGVASSLFELGGMVIIHDASGCNSTYTTHDEPRWYDMDSMLFVSAISEIEAIMGDDNKLISDIVIEAQKFHPRFIAIAGTPIPAMTGFDAESVAMQIESETGIPSFGFSTTGMHTYISGADKALAALAERFAKKDATPSKDHRINILGCTPLDFSTNGQVESMVKLLTDHGWHVNCTYAMNTSWESVENLGTADVNLVVSATGRATAHFLKETFGAPYLEAVPYGKDFSKKVIDALEMLYQGQEVSLFENVSEASSDACIIGEEIASLSLANALFLETGRRFDVLCPTNEGPLLRTNDHYTPYEEDIIENLSGRNLVISDPTYRNILTDKVRAVDWPHEACSGRIYRKYILNLIGDISDISEKL
ncbi:MAG: oxidoreductase [Clostridiales bacterium]|nr:oxidoreductase [Clostridiales bacterium]